MMLRHLFLLGTALVGLAGAAEAQQRRSREDLLDALTRHIQICAEISDQQARLACYDKLQTQVGDVQAPAPSPTPLANNPPPPLGPPPAGTPTTGGNQIGAAPLAPPPLMVPGGGPATLGGPGPTAPIGPGGPTPLAPPQTDPDRAFDPR